MALSLKELEQINKTWQAGKAKQAEMANKGNQPAPTFRKVPTLDELSHKQAADNVAETTRQTEKRQSAKEMNNISKVMGDNNTARYNSRFSLDTPVQKDAGKKLSELALGNAIKQAQETRYNAERIEESRARREASRKRIEDEVKAIQSKGDLASQEEFDRYDELLNTAKNRGFIEHDSPYLVSRDRYNQLAKTTGLENDLEPLAMALATEQGTRGRGVRAIKGMGYNSVDDYIDQLSKRYELTHDEVKDVVKTYQSDKTRGQEEKMASKMYDYGQKHPVLGGALSALASPASGVEGYYNTAANMLTGDDRNQSRLLSNITNESKRGGAESFDSKAGQNVYNFAVGGLGMALNAKGGGLPAITAMGGNTANEAMNMAIERGVAPEQAAAYGLAAGGADTLFNAVGFNAIDDALKKETVKSVGDVLRNLGVGALTEAGENVAQDITQTVADEIINGGNSELRSNYQNYIQSGLSAKDAFTQTAVDYATQLGGSAATGAIGGAIFSGMGMAGQNAVLPTLNKAAGKVNDWKTARDSQEASDLRARLLSNEAEVPTMDESNGIGAEPITEADGGAVNNQSNGIQVYRGYNNSDSPLESNLVREQTIEDVLGKEKSYNEDALPLQYYTESEDIANGYANQNAEYLRTLEEDARKEYRGLAIEGKKPQISEDEYASQRALEKYKTLTGNDYASNGRVDRLQINPTNPLDLSELGEQATVDDIYNYLSSKTGMSVSDIDDALMLNDLSLDGEPVNMYRLLRNEENGRVGRRFYDFLRNNGYDAVRFAEQGTNQWALLGENPNTEAPTQAELNTQRLKESSLKAEEESFQRSMREMQNEAPTETSSPQRHNPLEIVETYRQDKDGWIYGRNAVGDLFVGYNDGTPNPNQRYFHDTPEGRAEANSWWEGGNFAKEIKVKQPNAPKEESVSNKVMAEDIGAMPRANAKEKAESIESEPVNRESFNREGQAKFMTNTVPGAGIYNKTTYDNSPTLQEIAKIAKTSNEESFSNAMDVVKTRGQEWYDDVVNGKYQLGQDANKANTDFDTGMIILQGLADKLETAETDTERQAIVAQRNALLRKMKDFSHNMAIGLQAHAKWSNTADGAIMAGERLIGAREKVWAGQNKSKVENNRRLAEALKQQGYDGSMDNIPKEKPTLDELKEQVKNTLAKEYSSIDEQFSDSDIDYLAGLLDQNASVSELVDALNAKMATGSFGISAETQAEVNSYFKAMDRVNPESKEYAQLQAEAFRLIANEVNGKASALEKFDAWRYLAMLGNPKTMIRNWLGNQMFNVVTGISNNVAALGEEMADRRSIRKTGHGIKNRTKAFINPFDRSAIKAAQNDFNLMRYQSGAGTKYKDTKSAIQDASSTFDNGLVKFYEELVNKGISDTSAVRRKYATSLLGYMKANGLTEADMDASQKYEALDRLSRRKLLSNSERAELDSLRETHNKMEKARDYALKEAEYATFHEDNKFANWLSQTANSNDVAKIFIDGMVPFKKTPANVLRSGLEYSPLGITKSGYLMIKRAVEMKGDYADTYETKKLLGKGTKEVQRTYANDVIDSWSKSLTGTGLAALGYLLFSKGILQSGSEDEKYQNDLEGLQNFSIKFNVGGKDRTYTIDWAAPAVMPLLLGAEVKKIMDEQAIPGNEINPDDIVRIINSTLNPIMETSMLQGVQNTLETVARQASNANGVGEFAGGVLGSLATNLATGYVTQGIPTLSGQLARTIDGTRRTTDTKSTSSIMSEAEKQLRKTANKIPFASRLNTPYIDARGETQSNNPFEYSERFMDEPLKNVAKAIPNLLYQSLSPGYLAEVDTRASDQIARDAYNGLDENGKPIKDADVFADWKSSVKINGQKLAPKQLYDYRVAAGQANTQIREKLAQEEWFNNLSADRRTEILKSTNTLVDHIGKKAADDTYSTESSAYEAYENGGVNGVIDYYYNEAHNKDIKNALGSSADFQKQLYDSGDQDRIAKYQEGLNIAKQIMPDKKSLTEEQFLEYEKYGKSKLEKDLKYSQKANELDVSNSETFKKLVDAKVSDEKIKAASDAITSTVIGKDKYDRDKYMSFNDTTWGIYNKEGQAGLDNFALIQKAGGGKETYEAFKRYNNQAKTITDLPRLDATKYMKKVSEIERYREKGDADGKVSQTELLGYLNAGNYSDSYANALWDAFIQSNTYVGVKKNKNGAWAKTK